MKILFKTTRNLTVTLFLLPVGLTLQAKAQESLAPSQVNYFENHIRPALVQYCYDCHSEETGKTRGGLLLDSREAMLRGGDSGNALAGRTPTDSLFWKAITWQDLEMPPKDKMPEDVIRRFQTWLEMGAPDPRIRKQVVVESRLDIEAGRSHWAFQPAVASAEATIDSFISARLREASLSPVDAADAATLLRRLNFDLVGLPPSPEEQARFIADWNKDPQQATTSKVDELLARPQFGERWGRHWLDAVRYGESTGKDVNMTFPHIWRYRDYVFDSFNADKPYDEFIREQVAGDLLPVKSDAEWQENLIATGFLAMGTKGLNESNPRQHRMDVADEQIDTLSQVVLGLTVSCARCHDHKSDPIPMTDYYALAGIFLSTDTFFGTVPAAQNKRSTRLLELPLPDPVNESRRYTMAQIEDMKQQRQEMMYQRRTSRNTMSQQALLALGRRISMISATLDAINEDGIPITMAMAVQDADIPADAPVLVRGDVEHPAQEVKRGFLQVLPNGGPARIREGQSGRRELAEWLTSRDNPLTARVMVNRIWLKLFGQGLVTSPNDWGVQGQKPSHPELLDHLAVQFMTEGWSIKTLIRSMVLTEAYQRSSQYVPSNFLQDPDNRLLWRMQPRSLDAEAIRDSILTIGGGIDLKRPYGSAVSAIGDGRVGLGLGQEDLAQTARYRSAYLPILRDDLPEVLDLFDFADPNVPSAQRESSTVPSQALYLMNNPLVQVEAISMARNVLRHSPNREIQVQRAFLLAFGRLPDPADLEASKQFFSQYRPVTSSTGRTGISDSPRGPFRRRPGAPDGPGGRRPGRVDAPDASALSTLSPEQQAMAVFCQGLMASAEFRLLN